MTDFEVLRAELTRENARDKLQSVTCPHCDSVGRFELFTNPNNNGVGIECSACGQRHPLRAQRIMWLRGEAKRRDNDIVAVMQRCGFYCYACGTTFEALQAYGIGMSVHHTRPFAVYGEAFAKIPVCNICHEHLSLLQRTMQRFIDNRTHDDKIS